MCVLYFISTNDRLSRIISTDSHNRLLWAAVSLIMMLLIYLLICTVNISNQHTVFIYIYIASKSLSYFLQTELCSLISFVPHSNGSTNRMSTSALRTSSLDHEKHAAANNVQTPTLATSWESRAFWLAPNLECACCAPQHLQCQWSVLRPVHCVPVKGCRKMMSLVNETTP